MSIVSAIILTLLILGGIVYLQIFLSKMESTWPGLVLPILSFLVSALFPLNMVLPSEGMTAGLIVLMLLTWLLANIPTVILLVIYFACRGNLRRSKQLDKMNIQDLD